MSASAGSIFNPESATAKSAAATANWMKRSIFLTSFFSTQFRGSNPFTSAAKRVEWREASKSVMLATPDWPARRPFQVGSVPTPRGDTNPTPVITTLRLSATSAPLPRRGERLLLGLLRVLLDVVDGFFHPRDLLGVLVGDLDAELLLEGHDQLDGVEAVGAEVVDERSLRRHEVLLDPELVDDDLLHAIGNRLHEAPPGGPLRGIPFELWLEPRAARPTGKALW